MHAVPASVTPTLVPATIRLVERAVAEAAFEVTVTVTAPLPAPDIGATVAQVAKVDAVHEQFWPLAVTFTAAEPPRAGSGLLNADESTVILQGIPLWLIVNGWPPMLNVALRLVVVEFGRT